MPKESIVLQYCTTVVLQYNSAPHTPLATVLSSTIAGETMYACGALLCLFAIMRIDTMRDVINQKLLNS